jgi:DNA-binding transcriptional MerR regulator
MPLQRYDIIINHEQETDELTLEALAQRAGVHPSLIERFVQLGLIQPVGGRADLHFAYSSLIRLRMICRLRQSLGINCAGIAVIFDLLDKLSALSRENESLHAREHGGS